MSHSSKTTALALAFAVFFTGCTTGPDFSDTIAARAEEDGQVAAQYHKGEKLMALGEKNLRAGNKLVDKGQDQIRNGQSLQETARRAFCEDVGYTDPVCQ